LFSLTAAYVLFRSRLFLGFASGLRGGGLTGRRAFALASAAPRVPLRCGILRSFHFCASTSFIIPALTIVIPAKAGTHSEQSVSPGVGRWSHLGSRLRGNDAFF